MTSKEIRKAFFEFFKSKQHRIVPSAPMVVKNDPTLMFTNAGMNQFKDIFLGNRHSTDLRIADTQKCLRVSGKHNDLEEVGHDTYHHTMFEMLGNWSFGDYFKKEAIDWAWEFLTDVVKLPKDRLYATVFEGSEQDKLSKDSEAFNLWQNYLATENIIDGSKKDNFWEMGETGPCGPCSEIHIDLRPEKERKSINGRLLVNKDHPQVIEIWNLVFIQYNRLSNGSLVELPQKHVDTGMGLERLVMAVQDKTSNYDTDVFQPIIQTIANMSGIKYGESKESDIAMRVISDHLRAISFSIADGQLPSNNKAGYVIRRILRRAVRYGFTFLDLKEPFIYKLVKVLIETMGDTFPELLSQELLIKKVIHEEELSFLRTLESGIKRLDQIVEKHNKEGKAEIVGRDAFELYDTFGFPFDLSELILREKGLEVNKEEFEGEMAKQKGRSRKDALQESEDWVILREDKIEEFIGYDHTKTEVRISRYRKIKQKGKELYQLVFKFTPFYAESGGQVGDTGYLKYGDEKIEIIDTIKENDTSIHITKKLPADPEVLFEVVVNKDRRNNITLNHTSTHLLHYALRKVLGNHVEQKGSLVNPDHLRFDFSHFEKLSSDEVLQVEKIVNSMIRQNIPLEEKRAIPMTEAKDLGAVALFGEKYGDLVRVIKYGESVELCGGTHVKATGNIGMFKIISQSSVAAGIRRIEAITGEKVEAFIYDKIETLEQISSYFKSPVHIVKNIENIINENELLSKKIEKFEKDRIHNLKAELQNKSEEINGINVIIENIEIDSSDSIKDLCFQLKDKIDNLFMLVGANINGKAILSLIISKELVEAKKLDAGKIIREISKHIQGGGGGQPFFATAGGKKPEGIAAALKNAKEIITNL